MPSDRLILSLAGRELGSENTDFVIAEWSDAGETESDWIAPMHVHHEDDEAWYVLEGALRFRMGEEIFEAGPGTAVLAPKGIPHAYGNARRGELVRYLLVITPRIYRLVQALHKPGSTDYAAVFRAHASELLT